MKGLICHLLYCVICGHVNKESIQNDQQYFLISDNVTLIHKCILFVKAHQKKNTRTFIIDVLAIACYSYKLIRFFLKFILQKKKISHESQLPVRVFDHSSSEIH